MNKLRIIVLLRLVFFVIMGLLLTTKIRNGILMKSILVFLLIILLFIMNKKKSTTSELSFRIAVFVTWSSVLLLIIGIIVGLNRTRSLNWIQFKGSYSGKPWISFRADRPILTRVRESDNSDKASDSIEACGSAEGDQVSEIASNTESLLGIGYIDSIEAWRSAEGDQVSEIASNTESPSGIGYIDSIEAWRSAEGDPAGSGYEADSDSTAEYRDAQTYSQSEVSSPSLTDNDNGENAPYFQSQAALWVQACELVAFYFVFDQNNNNVGMTRTFMQRLSNRPEPDLSNFVSRSNAIFALPKDSDDERAHHLGRKGLNISNGPQPDLSNFLCRSNETFGQSSDYFGLSNDSDYENNSVRMKRLNDIEKVPRIKN